MHIKTFPEWSVVDGFSSFYLTNKIMEVRPVNSVINHNINIIIILLLKILF